MFQPTIRDKGDKTPFQYEANEELLIDDVTYRIAEHPVAPGMPYTQEGKQAVVYQLTAGAEHRALKVFKPRYRLPALVYLGGQLEQYAGLPGLAVCRRTVLTPQRHAEVLRQHPDMIYAVLMPWIEGPTWMQVLLEKRPLSPAQSLSLARSFAYVLATMKQRGLAHCDLSAPNVMLPELAGGKGVALVDVEQMYGPELRRPAVLPSGSPGYAHRAYVLETGESSVKVMAKSCCKILWYRKHTLAPNVLLGKNEPSGCAFRHFPYICSFRSTSLMMYCYLQYT